MTEVNVAGPMDVVGATSGDDIHRARRTRTGREVECRSAHLEFLNDLRRKVLRGCANHFIVDVAAVERDPRAAARLAADGNSRVAGFGRVETITGDRHRAGRDGGEVKEIPSIQRHILDDVRRDLRLYGVIDR